MTEPARVFITGASSGLGEALARAYAASHPGVRLGLLARRLGQLKALEQSLPQAQCRLYEVDVNDAAALQIAALDFIEWTGGADVVIANAGISAGTVTGESGDANVFAQVVQTNLIAMAQTFDPFVPVMRRQAAGRLVGIASVAGIRGLPGAGAYSASKAGVIAYLESLRVELHNTPVKVVTIAPGYIRSPMTAANQYPMPFLMDAERFAQQAVAKIGSGARFSVIPWQMGWIARVLRWLPRGLFDLLFSRAPRKARVGE